MTSASHNLSQGLGLGVEDVRSQNPVIKVAWRRNQIRNHLISINHTNHNISENLMTTGKLTDPGRTTFQQKDDD